MFYLGGKSESVEKGKQLAQNLLSSGEALKKFRRMIELQGGDPGVADDSKWLPQSHSTFVVEASRDGYVCAMDCKRIGIACNTLGGGRDRIEDPVDHAVGFVIHKKVGDRIATGEPLYTIHYNSEQRLHRARTIIEESYHVADDPPAKIPPLIHRVIPDVYA
jgi:pyrimidine-nucleoside phosphorylase